MYARPYEYRVVERHGEFWVEIRHRFLWWKWWANYENRYNPLFGEHFASAYDTEAGACTAMERFITEDAKDARPTRVCT